MNDATPTPPRASRVSGVRDPRSGSGDDARPSLRLGGSGARGAAGAALSGGASAAGMAIGVIAVFSALRVLSAAFVGLGVDEAYTAAIAHQLQLSYFDHPPLHLWLTHACSGLLGYGRWARLPFIALFAGSSWLLFDLTRRLFGGRAGAWAVLALNLSAFFTVAAGSWILPDGPLIFCLLAAAGQLAKLTVEDAERRSSGLWRWLAVGAWLGLAALSKYQAALFAIGVGALLVSTARGRRWLRRPGPYLAAVVTLAMLAPVIVWNARHGWASFAFQGGRALPQHGLQPLAPLSALVAQAALLSPWDFAPAVIAAWRAWRSPDPRQRLCLCLALPGVALFTLTPLWGQTALPHWAMPSWLFLFPLVGDLLAKAAVRRRWPAVWSLGATLACLGLWAVLVSDAGAGWIGRAWPQAFAKGDPTRESVEWTPLRSQLARLPLLAEPGAFLVSMKWNEAGRIQPTAPPGVKVLVFSDDPRGFADMVGAAGRVGRDAVIVIRPEDLDAGLARVRLCFTTVEPLGVVAFGRMGRPELQLHLFAGRDLLAACSHLGARGPAAMAQWDALKAAAASSPRPQLGPAAGRAAAANHSAASD